MDTDSSAGDLSQIPIYSAKQLSKTAYLHSSMGKTVALLRLGSKSADNYASKHFNLHFSPVANIGNKPEKNNAIKREADPAGLRRSRISLTESGTVFVNDLSPVMKTGLDSMFRAVEEMNSTHHMEIRALNI